MGQEQDRDGGGGKEGGDQAGGEGLVDFEAERRCAPPQGEGERRCHDVSDVLASGARASALGAAQVKPKGEMQGAGPSVPCRAKGPVSARVALISEASGAAWKGPPESKSGLRDRGFRPAPWPSASPTARSKACGFVAWNRCLVRARRPVQLFFAWVAARSWLRAKRRASTSSSERSAGQP